MNKETDKYYAAKRFEKYSGIIKSMAQEITSQFLLKSPFVIPLRDFVLSKEYAYLIMD